MDNRELINIAKGALANSYSPYSKFKVGSAVLCDNGKVYTGCNVENASYGATLCAERVAIFKAISEGERKFSKIAIVSQSDDETFENVAGDITFPCGMCRQVMAEFMLDGEVILENKIGDIKIFNIRELMPYSFSI